MSLRARVFGLVEVLLRVPPLFIIDELLKIGLGLGEIQEYDLGSITTSDSLNLDGNTTTTTSNPSEVYNQTFYRIVAVGLLRFLLSTLGCIIALCLFVLSKKYLMLVYMYMTSIGIVFISYWKNMGMVRIITAIGGDPMDTSLLDDLLLLNFTKIANDTTAFFILQNAITQLILSCIFANIHMGPRFTFIQRLIPIMFLFPCIAATLPLPQYVIAHTPVFASVLPLALVKYVLWSSMIGVVQSVYSGYVHARNYISNFGMSALIEAEWVRLCIPEVLRTFWLLRVLENAGLFFLNGLWNNIDDIDPLFRLLKSLMITGCDTLTAVLGITSIVSYVCHHIGLFVHWVMLSEDENDKSVGTVSAILFYILALQTGLTGLEPEKRFVRLCRNFCLLFTALLHFIHNMVNPLLMSLSAAHNPSLKRHLRVLVVCAFLVIFPILLLAYVWSHHETSPWLLAVSAFSIEVIVKVGVSLSIYTLFLLDARRQTFWESLDDYVYYIRAFGNTVEFCFGIFLFFNGAWILVFESGGAIRAVMMCIHAYFNIWCDARAGWSVFMKRRTAVHKIDSLPEAEEEQLRLLDDVCAICYQEMRTAKITRCRHFFHGVCLRKWLYVQDRCPLCHEILHSVEFDDKEVEVGPVHPVPPPEDDTHFER